MKRRTFLTRIGLVAAGAALPGWYLPALFPEIHMIPGPFVPQTLHLDAATRIHALPTGTVAVRPPHREFQGVSALRFPAILADWRWTEAMPIWVWLLETRHGLFLIDTGEKTRVLDPDYLEQAGVEGQISKRILRFVLQPEEQLDARLASLSLAPAQLDGVILTHLHIDHTDGLAFVNEAPVLISRTEWEQPFGAVTATFPNKLKKELLTYTPDGSPFGAGFALTPEITVVPTRGHTPGHQSVILRHSGKAYFFAGDVAFSEGQLLAGKRGGIVQDWEGTASTYARIRALAREEQVVFLPSHDPESVKRLMEGRCMAV